MKSLALATRQLSILLVDEGPHIAICSSPGFRKAIVPFEVTKDSSGDLRITLQAGQST